jgi:hypothetical protein
MVSFETQHPEDAAEVVRRLESDGFATTVVK